MTTITTILPFLFRTLQISHYQKAVTLTATVITVPLSTPDYCGSMHLPYLSSAFSILSYFLLCSLWSTSRPITFNHKIHTFLTHALSSFHSICPYCRNLLCCSTTTVSCSPVVTFNSARCSTTTVSSSPVVTFNSAHCSTTTVSSSPVVTFNLLRCSTTTVSSSPVVTFNSAHCRDRKSVV